MFNKEYHRIVDKLMCYMRWWLEFSTGLCTCTFSDGEKVWVRSRFSVTCRFFETQERGKERAYYWQSTSSPYPTNFCLLQPRILILFLCTHSFTLMPTHLSLPLVFFFPTCHQFCPCFSVDRRNISIWGEYLHRMTVRFTTSLEKSNHCLIFKQVCVCMCVYVPPGCLWSGI